jgi:hypothetical protein
LPDPDEVITQQSKLRASASNLRNDAAVAEIFRAFTSHRVDARLLKGPALNRWYPNEPARSYMDCDIWVPPHAREAASSALGTMGFMPHDYEESLPDWWQEHAFTWSREADGVVVDLHRTLQGAGVDAEACWRIVSERAEVIEVAGQAVPILAPPALFLYVTLHAAHHGEGWAKAISHVEAGLGAVDRHDVVAALELAQRLNAVDSFAAGLRLTSAGAATADQLGLGGPGSVTVALRASAPPPVALGIAQLADAKSVRGRLQILIRKAAPPPAFIRHWWPAAGESRRMLVIAYMYRPIWLLRMMPRAIGAWRAARRSARQHD